MLFPEAEIQCHHWSAMLLETEMVGTQMVQYLAWGAQCKLLLDSSNISALRTRNLMEDCLGMAREKQKLN